MCDYMITNRQCKRNALSGLGTIESSDRLRVAYLCKQHADMSKHGFLDLTKVQWTIKVIPDLITNQKENTMNTTIIPSSDVRVAHKFTIHCNGKKGCGKYHATTADVRLCVGAAPAPVQGKVIAHIFDSKKGDKMESLWFAKDQKINAIKWAKESNGKFNSAKNGNGYWVTFQLKS